MVLTFMSHTPFELHNSASLAIYKGETSPNRAYLATVLRTYAQIQPDGGTSDTLVTLCDIVNMLVEEGAEYDT